MAIIKDNLTSQQFNELTRVTKDVFFFAGFVNIVHPLRGKVKFNLYDYQKTVLWYFLTERFNIILKFRQAGITELISLFCLWFAMYHNNKNIVIISIKDRVAKKVLRKIKYMYRHLPPHLKVTVVNGRTKDIGTAEEIEFGNGSTISSVPTTEEAGRSEALSLLVVDEAAIIRWANTIWAAAFPTLSTGGAAIVNSTPYGMGNWFHSTWVDAISGGNTFNAIRLRWDMHPERDQDWYDDMASSLGLRRTAQEIDGDFLTSGNSVFDLVDIRAIEESLIEFPPIQERQGGALKIFKRPEPSENYFLGADVATGRSRDYSAFTIMDKYGEEVAVFKKKIAVTQFSNLIMDIGTEYNRALIAPESNDIGLAVTSKMEDQGYRNLYYSKAFLRKKGKRRTEQRDVPGWYTTSKNRGVIIAGLEEDIRKSDTLIKDPFFVQEAYTFIYDERNKPIAMGKGGGGAQEDDLDGQVYTDDSILAKCITNQVRKGRIKNPIILPR